LKSGNPFLSIHPEDARIIKLSFKFCPGCSRVILRSGFGKNKCTSDGLQQMCFECRHLHSVTHRDSISSKRKAYYRRDPNRTIERTKQYRIDNPNCRALEYSRHREKQLAIHKEYYKTHRAEILERGKKYQAANKAKRRVYIANYIKQKRRSDPEFKILSNLRNRLYCAAKRKRFIKSAKTLELLGCTLNELRAYLQAQFTDGMTWDNYGPYWHIDHKKPCLKFNLVDPEQQRACFHFTNLQPLKAPDNLKKWAHYPYPCT